MNILLMNVENIMHRQKRDREKQNKLLSRFWCEILKKMPFIGFFSVQSMFLYFIFIFCWLTFCAIPHTHTHVDQSTTVLFHSFDNLYVARTRHKPENILYQKYHNISERCLFSRICRDMIISLSTETQINCRPFIYSLSMLITTLRFHLMIRNNLNYKVHFTTQPHFNSSPSFFPRLSKSIITIYLKILKKNLTKQNNFSSNNKNVCVEIVSFQ